jgi:hypothetical protein
MLVSSRRNWRGCSHQDDSAFVNDQDGGGEAGSCLTATGCTDEAPADALLFVSCPREPLIAPIPADLTAVTLSGPCATNDAGASALNDYLSSSGAFVWFGSPTPGVCHVELTFATGFTYSTDVEFASMTHPQQPAACLAQTTSVRHRSISWSTTRPRPAPMRRSACREMPAPPMLRPTLGGTTPPTEVARVRAARTAAFASAETSRCPLPGEQHVECLPLHRKLHAVPRRSRLRLRLRGRECLRRRRGSRVGVRRHGGNVYGRGPLNAWVRERVGRQFHAEPELQEMLQPLPPVCTWPEF